MKLPRDKRWRWGLGTVMVTLIIVMTTGANQPAKDVSGVVPPATRHPPVGPAATAKADRIDSIALERLKRERMQVAKAELFHAKSWYVPPPPPPPAPPPAPTAPPLPFTFLGKMLEPQGKLTIILAGDNRVYLVSEGETIDNTYHVDGVEGGQLALTYLPLQKKQYLNIGDAP